MCVQCAVRTPVGYRCRECARAHEDRFFNATSRDYLIIAGVCGSAGLGLGLLMVVIGLNIALVGLVLGFPAGGAIAEIALRLTGRRRGRYSGEAGGIATAIGGLAGGVGYAYLNYMSVYAQYVEELGERLAAQYYPPMDVQTLILSNVGLLIFVGCAAFAVYGRYRMKM
jgi:hypothetical protein